MKKQFLCIFSVLFAFSAFSQVNILWQKRLSSTGSNQDKVNAMVVDKFGNSYVTGTGFGTSGTYDYFTAKYNSAGTFQWKMEYNGTGNGLDEARSVAVDTAGNVYVTGWSNAGAHYDISTVKYNGAGVQKWAVNFNGATNGLDDGYVVLCDKMGSVYVVGGSDSSATTGEDYITIKYDTLGVKKWHRRYTFNGLNPDAAYAATLDATGNIYVTGYSWGGAANDFDYATVKYNTNGALQWSNRYNNAAMNKHDEARAIAVDATGAVFVTGYSRGTGISSSNYDYATIKISNTGAAVWNTRYDGPAKDYDRANSIAIDGKGGVYVTGRSKQGASSAEDIVTIKYRDSSNTAVQKWLKIYDGAVIGFDEGKAIAIDGSKSVYVNGYSYGGSTKNHDFVTLKYDSMGTFTWITKYNGTASNIDQGAAIQLDPGGNVYVAGSSIGTGSNFDFETIKYCQFKTTGTPDVAICAGKNTQLNATTTGAVSYTWTPSAGLSSTTIANPVANPTITTTYIVTSTNSTGCSDDDTITVTVNQLPSVSIAADGPTTFCQGDSVVLTAVAIPTNRTWSTSDTSVSITVKVSGTYILTVTDTNGCSNTAQVVVTMNPNPVPVVTQNFNTLNTGSFAVYQWYLAGNIISGATSQSYIPLVNGTYKVCVTDGNGCTGCSNDFLVSNVGIDEHDNISMLNVYPNPSSGELNIEMNLNGSGEVKVKLFNLTGQLIFSEDIAQTRGTYKKQLNIAEQAKGTYYLQVVSEKGVLNQRIVVQ